MYPMPTIFARRPRGRRPTSLIPTERKRHLDAARLMDFEGIDAPTVAKFLGCKVRTVYYWANRARDYPEYETLRRKYAAAG